MKKLAFLAEAKHVKHIKAMVRSRQFPSFSAFLRDAIDEKLRRTRREHLNAQVARYRAEGYADEDRDLVAMQAFGDRAWPEDYWKSWGTVPKDFKGALIVHAPVRRSLGHLEREKGSMFRLGLSRTGGSRFSAGASPGAW
jgi:Arc/MetJ-type ribon-helix-helix transcriptional regulator